VNQDFSGWRIAPPEIQTERLHLRCPQEQDGPELYAAISESLPELQPWFAWTADLNLTPENSIVTAAYARERFLTAAEMQFYLFAKGGTELLGVCGLSKPDWIKLTFEICYWLRTRFVGHGYMTEAVIAVTQFALIDLQARRIEARCDPANESGIAVALHAGYVYEQTATSDTHHSIQGEQTKIAMLVRLA
jgi:RimJ/RimL family protein N-acetyltransferase